MIYLSLQINNFRSNFTIQMIRFQKKYFILTLLLLSIEIFIALFLHDRFIRPYVGDFLVVILIYCFIKSFIKISVLKACIVTLLFAYAVELLQYLNLVEHLGLQHSKLATTLFGFSFEWRDMLAYTLGILFVLILEK